jgi:predicted nuclease of predicted toxin-antitoxin system
MRLRLDDSVPARLRRALPDHSVRTVAEVGWSGISNGKLLALAADTFDAVITVDKNLQYQQNLNRLPVAVVVLDTSSNELTALLPLVPALQGALASLEPRTLVRVAREP